MPETDNELLKQQHELLKYSIEQFDKTVIYIASGSLGVSFAFIKDIITDLDSALHKNWLIASWIVFAIVIFLSLFAHWLSYMAQIWGIKNSNLDYEEYTKKSKRWNISIRALNLLNIVGIFIGALYLLYFIKINI